MALCTTLEEYGGGVSCANVDCALMCGGEQATATVDSPVAMTPDLLGNEAFQAGLRRTLDFYNIDLNYQISQSTCAPAAGDKAGEQMCVVTIPPHVDQQVSFVTLAFPEKEKFMLSKFKYMIFASMLILLFTAIVLWLANWWLMKQKRLLRTNADIYNNMAHEFRTPLTNIQLATSLLSKDPSNPGNAKFVDIITKENTRLIQQVERVLHLARIDNGDYALKNEPLKIRSLLSTVMEEMQMRIEEKKANVSFHDIPDTYEILGDKQHLMNVFRNLIENALKYSEQAPEIHISAQEEKDGILLSFQDNGIGIPASKSRMIFEKFQRIHDGQHDEQKGFGLGLAYVKRIVELHKGFIQLDCDVSQGSRFNVFLPKYC